MSQSFDVIVLDVMLPGLDGVAMARRLRENRNQTPVLMLTARDAVDGVERAIRILEWARDVVRKARV